MSNSSVNGKVKGQNWVHHERGVTVASVMIPKCIGLFSSEICQVFDIRQLSSRFLELSKVHSFMRHAVPNLI